MPFPKFLRSSHSLTTVSRMLKNPFFSRLLKKAQIQGGRRKAE
jgi:hypothetical protein